jgi:hypothetical protein
MMNWLIVVAMLIAIVAALSVNHKNPPAHPVAITHQAPWK